MNKAMSVMSGSTSLIEMHEKLMGSFQKLDYGKA